MKKNSMKVMTALIATSLMCSSCMVGSLSLFNKYRDWQTHMTSSKFVNAIVAYVLGAICYPITLFVDSLVLNTIEFWSGSNPVHANIGQTRQVMGEDGRCYAVTTLENGYELKDANGNVTLLLHHADDDSWWMEQNGVKQEMFRYSDNGKKIQASINGQEQEFSIDEAGVYQARMTANGGRFYAMN